MRDKVLLVLFMKGVMVASFGTINTLNPEANFMLTGGLINIGVFITAIPLGYVAGKLGELLYSFKKGQEFQTVMESLEKYKPEFGPKYVKVSKEGRPY
jgi:hypothetical protein